MCSGTNYKKIIGDTFMDFLKNENTFTSNVEGKDYFSALDE
jgi:hypothetical protein